MTAAWVSIVLPQGILIASAGLMAIAARFAGWQRAWKPFTVLAILYAGIALGNETRLIAEAPSRGPVVQDSLSVVMQWVSLLAGTVLIFGAFGSASASDTAPRYARLLLSMAGAMLTCVAHDLLLLFAALELTVLPLATQPNVSVGSSEETDSMHPRLALDLVASMLLLLGFAALYGASGATDLTAIYDALAAGSAPDSARTASVSQLGIVATVLIFSGLAIWLGAVPFHFGWPEIFERGSALTAGMLIVWPRIAAFVVLIRVCCLAMPSLEAAGQWMAWVLAVSSMTIGAVRALAETNIRRRLAYTSIAHSGFALAAVAVGFWELGHPDQGLGGVGLPNGLQAGLACFLCHLLATAGLIAVIGYLRKPEREIGHLDDLQGLARSEPLAAISLLVCALSLAGCPPWPGFWGNLFVLGETLSVPAEFSGELLPAPARGFSLLAFVAVVSAVIIAAVYLRIVAILFLDPQIGRSRAAGGRAALAAALCVALLLAGGSLFPGWLWAALDQVDLTRTAITSGAP